MRYDIALLGHMFEVFDPLLLNLNLDAIVGVP
jgi:hypothetical protein